MKDVKYKLITPVDGIKELILFAPSRKQIKFAAFVKSSFMSVAVEMAAKIGDDEKQNLQEKQGQEEVKISGKEMLLAMYGGSVDVGDMLERFFGACTDSSMCNMNGGQVPSGFWDNISMEDAEGLFSAFVENFITI